MPAATIVQKEEKTWNREIREIHEFHAHLAVETGLAVEIAIWPWIFLIKRLWYHLAVEILFRREILVWLPF